MLAWCISAREKSELLRSVSFKLHLERLASKNIDFLKFAPLRLEPDKLLPRNFAPCKLEDSKLAFVTFASRQLTFSISALIKFASSKFVWSIFESVRMLFDRLVLFKLVPFRLIPKKFISDKSKPDKFLPSKISIGSGSFSRFSSGSIISADPSSFSFFVSSASGSVSSSSSSMNSSSSSPARVDAYSSKAVLTSSRVKSTIDSFLESWINDQVRS